MNVRELLRGRLTDSLGTLTDRPSELAELLLPSQDSRFGDYQANCAMPLAKLLGQPPRRVAEQLAARLDVSDACLPAEIAGPGFINLKLRDDWISEQLGKLLADQERMGVDPVPVRRTIVIDFSSPNVAKPLHVGHIRSTIIGDSLCRLLRFVGHSVISDNHLGDWGTQFGMIIYGYKHFLNSSAYRENPLLELARLYRLVHQLIEYHEAVREGMDSVRSQRDDLIRYLDKAEFDPAVVADPKLQQRQAKQLAAARRRLDEVESELARLEALVRAVESDAGLGHLAAAHPEIGQAVLAETARLHAGDPENLGLWKQFMPPCLAGIDAIYRRLSVTFDHTLGESFYQERLAGVVEELESQGLAVESEGAKCVFLEGQSTPMIVQKQDGAFLYATTDLATIQYRTEQFRPDAILYVVGSPQTLHFEQLFAAARKWGYHDVELRHIHFGAVLDESHRPFRTRAGDVVGLEGLLDEAVARALAVVSENDDSRGAPELSPAERQRVAEVVGIGALEYADLSQNRESDYVFSYEKMLGMKGNTATYMQYSYARVQSIFAKGGFRPDELRQARVSISVEHPSERALGVALLRFPEAVERAAMDYRPNHLTGYLFDLAGSFAEFFEQCPVLRAETPQRRDSRLALCDLTARTIRQGLALLGIDVVEKM
jgi:arginyl-tRNA synthetase